MKRRIWALMGVVLAMFGCKRVSTRPDNHAKPSQSFYQFRMQGIGGEMIDFSAYKGKKVLVVNVASKCGNTPQYARLEELYKKHGDKLVILGFPANDFMGQEPGTNEEIATFCRTTYDVTFPMFAKVVVTGKDRCELYRWLSQKELNGWNDQQPNWNFSKYLISEEGELMQFFTSSVDPMGDEMLAAISK